MAHEVMIIGGGVVGMAVAYGLARRGRRRAHRLWYHGWACKSRQPKCLSRQMLNVYV